MSCTHPQRERTRGFSVPWMLRSSVRPWNITSLLLHGSALARIIVARLCVVVTRPARRVSSHVALPARVLSPSRVQCVFTSCTVCWLHTPKRNNRDHDDDDDDNHHHKTTRTFPLHNSSVPATRSTNSRGPPTAGRESGVCEWRIGEVWRARRTMRTTPCAVCARSAEPGSSDGAPS